MTFCQKFKILCNSDHPNLFKIQLMVTYLLQNIKELLKYFIISILANATEIFKSLQVKFSVTRTSQFSAYFVVISQSDQICKSYTSYVHRQQENTWIILEFYPVLPTYQVSSL